MNKKSQTFTVEFILAFLLFSSTIILSVKMISNLYQPQDFDDLMKETELLSDNILSEGYPEKWTRTDVIRAGITTNDVISENKMRELYSLDYYEAKSVLGIKKDFFIYFTKNTTILNIFYNISAENSTINSCGYGNAQVNQTYTGSGCLINFNDVQKNNMIKISRLVVYNGSVLTCHINMWDK